MPAVILSDFNWKIINFVKDAGNFYFDLNKEILCNAGRATLDVAHGLYDTVAHPITSFRNTVTGLVHLADTAITIIDIADVKLGEIAYGTADKNQLQVIQDLGRQSRQLLNTIIDYGKKEGVPRLAGKATYAATSFGVDCFITGKSLQLVNKFAKIAQSSHMGHLLQKAANVISKAPELEAITAEGLKVAVPKGAELCALSEAANTAKQVGKVEQLTSTLSQASKLSAASEALLKNFNPSHYDPKIINPQVLAKAVETLKDIPGAMGSNGALKQILENAKLGLNANLSLKGMAYELEKALQLEALGEKILEFGKKIIREFDIVTKTKLIECKNINWSELQLKKIQDLIGNFGQQKSIAEKIGMQFELHSKKSIPDYIKKMLIDKNITFIEG